MFDLPLTIKEGLLTSTVGANNGSEVKEWPYVVVTLERFEIEDLHLDQLALPAIESCLRAFIH